MSDDTNAAPDLVRRAKIPMSASDGPPVMPNLGEARHRLVQYRPVMARLRLARGTTNLFRTTLVGTGLGAAAATGILTCYVALVSAAALVTRSPGPGKSPVPEGEQHRRFAMMIPAHNEELGIARTLLSLRELEYPRHLYEVHVVADNCTDATLAVARDLGFEAHDRVAPDQPGKGHALNWLFDRLQATKQFDSYVIVDADTSVHADFLTHMARALDDGAEAAQGFYGVRDAETSPAASFRLAALACRHHLRPLGRMALGGSSGLFGNGMAFSPTLLEANPWTGHLTEDMELQLGLLLQGHVIAYIPAAVVEAEMPATLEAAQTQNERWELGRVQLARAFVPRLAHRVLSGPNRGASLDALLDELVPPMSVLAAANVACLVGTTLLTIIRPSRVVRTGRSVSATSCLLLAGHVVAGLRSIDAPAHVYRSLLRSPAAVAWKVALWLKVFARPADGTWIRTPRNVVD